NPQEAVRDAQVRQQVLEHLEQKLKTGGIKSLISNSAYRKFLSVSNGAVQIDKDRINEEARFDGKYVLRTNTTLPASE
ncbi:transposase IS4 family protein, partial [Calderihabitans maritimus]